jgi:type VI secretion system protein ImpL
MRILKAILRFLISRRLWTFIGVAILCALIWLFGPLLSVGELQPFASDLARLVTVGAILILWLLSVLVGQLRAARANQVFVTELARAEPVSQSTPGDGAVAEINTKFQAILSEMKRSKLGNRKFLREMPWYVIIGPPGTGKTTALRQSGLHFPIDLGDDLKGVGGTRNCDWFFTDDAVLVDTAGRYTEQASAPDLDAAEWGGFLDLLRKHRGRRALNGVIVAISVRELLGPEADLRAHGREIRKRLGELREKLGLQLPVYLMITKADLIPGFETFFADLTNDDREQVWGATLATDARVDGIAIEREMAALAARAERRLVGRLADDVPLPVRAEMFRFPAQFLRLQSPLKLLVDAVFGETRYDEASWLRGFYFSSATQEGSPIDRLVGDLAGAFGIAAPPTATRRHGEKRSYFLRRLLTDLIFPEAGLGLFDAAAEERRKWVWRGTLAAAMLATVVLSAVFVFSYSRYTAGIGDQERQLTGLQARLANVAARQAPTDPLDLDVALAAMAEVAAAGTDVQTNALTALGPTAEAELAHVQRMAYDRSLRNILEPRMVALLEATMWRQIRDPEFLLGALKTYNMMTGLAPYDRAFAEMWWQNDLPAAAPIDPFPTEAALAHQLAAFERLADEEQRIAPDRALVAAALETVCEIPIAVRAYNGLMSQSQIIGLPEWTPAEVAGPNGARVLSRLSGRTLRVGLPGAFTYAGFHGTVLPLIPEAAAQAALDRAIFAGGCQENASVDAAQLEVDIMALYQKDFIAQWDGFLRDIRLAPITDLRIATDNLKDLATEDSALKRLLRAVVLETELTRPEEAAAGGGSGVPPGLISAATKRLGSVGRLAKTGARIAGSSAGSGAAGEDSLPGETVARHFAPLKAVIDEVDGVPPLLNDAVAALGALANELQTVSASPDPEAALLARGGLPQLTGAIANVALGLPDPIDDWVRGIAGDTISVTREAVLSQLNARWRADVLPFCRSATEGRYPFEESSRIDVNVADFQRLFGPGGLVDGFVTTHLLPYVDTTVRPWQWRADFGLSPDSLQPFERARTIRDALFPGGAGPVMAFIIEPKDLSANASRVTLNVDGQSLVYFNAAVRPMPMTWPGPDGTNLVSLSFAPLDGSAEAVSTETGAWAFLRLIRKARLSRTDLPELFRLRLALGGFAADYDLRAASVENPFDLTMFGGFRCPDGI